MLYEWSFFFAAHGLLLHQDAISQLMEKMTSSDVDLRYMAASDLLDKLNLPDFNLNGNDRIERLVFNFPAVLFFGFFFLNARAICLALFQFLTLFCTNLHHTEP